MSEQVWKAIPNDRKFHYDFTFDYEDGRVVPNYHNTGTHRLVPVEPTTDEVWVSNVNGADTVVDVDGRCIDTVMSIPKMDVYLVPKGEPA